MQWCVVTYSALDEEHRHHVINKKVEGFGCEGWDRVLRRLTVTVNSAESMCSRLRGLGKERRVNRPADVPLLCTEFEFRFYGLSWYSLI
jgi:hypothetical protein